MNSLIFLINDAVKSASSYSLLSGTTATGFDINNSTFGNRGKTHRTTKSSSEVIRAYVYSSDLDIDYCIISRADLMLTQNTTRVRLKQRNSGGSWSYISGVDYNPLDDIDLIGINSQDLIIPCSPSDLRGVALSTIPVSGSEASEIGKFYACISKQIAGVISLNLQYESLEKYTTVNTIDYLRKYEIEGVFSLSFSDLTKAEITSVDDFIKDLYLPFFIYDPNTHLWEHQLEHVVLISHEEIFNEKDNYSIVLNLGRIRQDV